MVQATAHELLVAPNHVLVCSTGTIGVKLPMKRVLKGIQMSDSSLTEKGWHAAAAAILTTDTRTKEIALEFEIGRGEKITIGAMAKGSGMINPFMATMLAFVTTDAKINARLLHKALKQAVHNTFNMITVDNDKSTNDTVLILASGLSDSKEITDGSERFRRFQEALTYLCEFLAKEIVRDGEGATKLFEVKVIGASSALAARRAAKQVAGSNLVKTAVYGADANWGRIAGALGDAGVKLSPLTLSIRLENLTLVKKGEPVKFSEAKAKLIMKKIEFKIGIDLGQGTAEAAAWGCDLSYGYVKINAKYRT
jgi:glutamate N-acetyltransferase/amino-acid N-acetyltransferase